MKLGKIIISAVLAPTVAYAVSQILWVIYAVVNLNSVIPIANYSDLTLGISALVFVGICVLVLKPKKTVEKSKDTTVASSITSSLPSPSALNRDFTIKDLTETVVPSRKKPLLEFIVIGDGVNLHQVVPYSKDAKYVSEESKETYEINEKNLLLVKPFWGRKKLVAIFNSKNPVKPQKSDDDTTAEILALAASSSVTSTAMKELFAKHFETKKILFFIIIGVIGVVVFLILSGGIRI